MVGKSMGDEARAVARLAIVGREVMVEQVKAVAEIVGTVWAAAARVVVAKGGRQGQRASRMVCRWRGGI